MIFEEEDFTIGELKEKNKIKKYVPCKYCGETTVWFFRDSYYAKKQDEPICKKCREKMKRENDS